jgi:predicted flap endonuclease-1-like 5' DNA nuclease
MDQSTLILILVGALVVVVSLWWLLGSASRRSPEAVTRDGHPQEVSPVITGPAAGPADVPPPIPAMPEPAPATPAAAEPAPAPAPAAGPPDELTRMKGVGPKVAALLNGLGITRFDQIAAWDAADIARIDAELGAFKGRIARDQWVDQARLLAAGDTAGYEARFGKLG